MRKRKVFQPKIWPFKGVYYIDNNSVIGAEMEFITGMGYLFYEDPLDGGCFISDKVLTYGWLKKSAKRFGIKASPWPFTCDLTDELDEGCW